MGRAVQPAAVLVLPGYADSGPDHWQTLWERRHGYVRVEQDDWLMPECEAWVATLERAVCAAPAPVVLVAHSLGCVLVAHWARGGSCARVRAAFLVAPADVDRVRDELPEVASFAPVPMARLPFPSLVVASTSDPFVTAARARAMAAAWGARLVDVGDAGHLNAEAGLGEWTTGRRLLDELLATS
jgi:predicted alpha/beta hydrolase family esterase